MTGRTIPTTITEASEGQPSVDSSIASSLAFTMGSNTQAISNQGILETIGAALTREVGSEGGEEERGSRASKASSSRDRPSPPPPLSSVHSLSSTSGQPAPSSSSSSAGRVKSSSGAIERSESFPKHPLPVGHTSTTTASISLARPSLTAASGSGSGAVERSSGPLLSLPSIGSLRQQSLVRLGLLPSMGSGGSVPGSGPASPSGSFSAQTPHHPASHLNHHQQSQSHSQQPRAASPSRLGGGAGAGAGAGAGGGTGAGAGTGGGTGAGLQPLTHRPHLPSNGSSGQIDLSSLLQVRASMDTSMVDFGMILSSVSRQHHSHGEDLDKVALMSTGGGLGGGGGGGGGGGVLSSMRGAGAGSGPNSGSNPASLPLGMSPPRASQGYMNHRPAPLTEVASSSSVGGMTSVVGVHHDGVFSLIRSGNSYTNGGGAGGGGGGGMTTPMGRDRYAPPIPQSPTRSSSQHAIAGLGVGVGGTLPPLSSVTAPSPRPPPPPSSGSHSFTLSGSKAGAGAGVAYSFAPSSQASSSALVAAAKEAAKEVSPSFMHQAPLLSLFHALCSLFLQS